MVEWLIETGSGTESVRMRIDRGTCSFASSAGQPAVTLRLSLGDLADLVEGRTQGSGLFMRRRLTVSGDVLLATRLPHIFGLTSPGPGRP